MDRNRRSRNLTEPTKNEVGYTAEFTKITVDDVAIRAFELGCRGISRRGGLKNFIEALSKVI